MNPPSIKHAYSDDLIVDLEVGSYNNSDRLRDKEGGSADDPSDTVRTSNFNGLPVNNTWYLYARDVVAGDAGYIDEWSITINYSDPLPSKPTLSAPGSSDSSGQIISDTTPRLQWNSVPGATYYNFGVRNLSTGALVVDEDDYTSTSFTTGTLTRGHNFRWNVQACNSTGCSDYSNYYYFQIDAPNVPVPDVPRLSSPGSSTSPGPDTSDTTPRLRWSSVPDATYYNFGVRNLSTGALVVNEDDYTSTSFNTGTLTRGHNYRWNVQACNASGCSNYSNYHYFQIDASEIPNDSSRPSRPESPSPGRTRSPLPTIDGTQVTLNWSASSGATYYEVGIRDIESNRLVVDTTTTRTSYNAVLSADKEYRWNVAACSDMGCSNFTDALYFRTHAREVAPLETVDIHPLNVALGSPTVVTGGLMSVSWSITNNGNTEAVSSNSQVRITNSNAPSAYGRNTNNVGEAQPTGIIPAGETRNQSTTVIVPNNPGTYYVWIIADNNEVLTQADYDNDYSVSRPFEVVTESTSSSFDDWISPYNGVTVRDYSRYLLNNVGILFSDNNTVYSCVRIFDQGEPAKIGNYSTFDVILKVEEQPSGVIKINVTATKPFNLLNALNEYGDRPTCSGSYDASSGRYTDLIEINRKLHWVDMALEDESTLEFKLLDAKVVQPDTSLIEDAGIPFLSFPLSCATKGENGECSKPYTDGAYTHDTINSFLDHHMERIYNPDGIIQVYTGEIAEGPAVKRGCYPLTGGSTLSIELSNLYRGTTGCREKINYDGHPGYDYHASYGMEVTAAASGRVVAGGCILKGIDRCDNWGYLGIDHGNGYVTQYGHMTSIQFNAGDEVDEGEVIGLSSDKGVKEAPHLHFEVLKKVESFTPSTHPDYYKANNWKVVDPYGWEGDVGDDPLYKVTQAGSVQLWTQLPQLE